MSFWSKFPFLRLAIFFIGGIVAAETWGVIAGIGLAILLASFASYSIIFLLTKQNPLQYHTCNPVLGFLACAFFFGAGYAQYEITDRGQLALSEKLKDIQYYRGYATEDLHVRPKSKYAPIMLTHYYSMEGRWVLCDPPTKVNLYAPSQIELRILYRDVIIVKTAPKLISPPQKSNDASGFNFYQIAKMNQTYYSSYLRSLDDIMVFEGTAQGFYPYLYKLLRYSKAMLRQHLHDDSAYAVVCALLLGDKDALDAETRNAYVDSGSMHVLAVSGLHVGILYMLIVWCFGLFRLSRKFHFIQHTLSIVLLWGYATLTGLSPSVLRATTMFSVVALGKFLNKRQNIYNSLGLSAIILLMVDPRSITNVGFQLSYLAVLGIAYMTDKIYSGLKVTNRLLDKLWMLTAVSLAAQLATLPLSLYYFGQFPTYFLFANWVVVPLAGLVLYLGIFLLIAGGIASVGNALGYALEFIVGSENKFLLFLSKLPYSKITGIHFSKAEVALLYAILMMWFVFRDTKKYFALMTTLLLVAGLLTLMLCTT